MFNCFENFLKLLIKSPAVPPGSRCIVFGGGKYFGGAPVEHWLLYSKVGLAFSVILQVQSYSHYCDDNLFELFVYIRWWFNKDGRTCSVTQEGNPTHHVENCNHTIHQRQHHHQTVTWRHHALTWRHTHAVWAARLGTLPGFGDEVG